MALCRSTGHGPAWPPGELWTVEVFDEVSPVNEPLFILAVLPLLEQGDHEAGRLFWG